MISAASSYLDILPFELVDISLDYGDFRGIVNVFEVGSKQNFKITTLINQVVNMLQTCSQATSGHNTLLLNKSYMFKMCLKRLFKKLCKLQKLKSSNNKVIFVPELITDISVADFESVMNSLPSDTDRIELCTLCTCPKIVNNFI